jgi:hypothetical protein
MRSLNYLSGLTLNLNPPDFGLLSSWDYRCESPAPGIPFLSDPFTAFYSECMFICQLNEAGCAC